MKILRCKKAPFAVITLLLFLLPSLGIAAMPTRVSAQSSIDFSQMDFNLGGTAYNNAAEITQDPNNLYYWTQYFSVASEIIAGGSSISNIGGNQTPVPEKEKKEILNKLDKMLKDAEAKRAEVIKLKEKATTEEEKAALDTVASKYDALFDEIKAAKSAVEVGLEAVNDALESVQKAVGVISQTAFDLIRTGKIVTTEVKNLLELTARDTTELLITIAKSLVKLIGGLLGIVIDIITTPIEAIIDLFSFAPNAPNDLTISTKPYTSVNVCFAIDNTLVFTGVTDENGILSTSLPLDVYFAESAYGESGVCVLNSDRIVFISGGRGGIIQLPDIEEPEAAIPDLSGHNHGAPAGIIAGAAVGVIMLISAAWYIRRRRTKATR